MHFEFATPTRIIFGRGVVKEVGPLARGMGGRALVVTGKNPERAKTVVALLESIGVGYSFHPVAGEPDIRCIEAGVVAARRERCDLVIAMGGGSALDAGKAIAAMMTNPGELHDCLEIIGRGQALTEPPAKFIAIPTTAGTGSEVTRNAVLASPERQVKVSLRSPLMPPTVALIDPELTLELPPALTASTGLDALTQLIEPYVCLRANPMTDALCREGISRVARSLLAAYQDGQNIDAREDMALASLFGGLALANSGLGAVHGLAGPIGGMFPAPHGAICAALLPHIMEANICALKIRQPDAEALGRYRTVARGLTQDPAATAHDGVEWVRRLVESLEVAPLRRYGITAESIADIVEKAVKASSMKANPIVLTPAELAAAIQRAL
jgi:alcohol dehydrogenase class IV